MNWCNYRWPEDKKAFSLDIFKKSKRVKPNIILMIVNSLIYIILLYKFGINRENIILGNLKLIKFLVLVPMLLSVCVIDYKHQIIPNRLNLTMFEFGLIFAFIAGFYNTNILTNSLLGSLVGGGIFLFITLIGGLIAGKEAMGFGDVKLMGALGLFFGWAPSILITVISFLVGAIISIILLVSKTKKTDEYIPFGPFIVIGAFVMMFVPFNTMVMALLKIFTLGMFA